MTSAMKKKLRQLWRPKMPELKAQCPSCPFLDGNDDEWEGVCLELADKHGLNHEFVDAERSRFQIKMEIENFGDFHCHQTAYDQDNQMRERPIEERRQCPGASKHFKGEPVNDDAVRGNR